MSLIEKYPVHIQNTLSRKKEKFVPNIEGKVGMYVCGPTVYGDPHLGHARGAITFDLVFRYLKFLGYQVRYVRNITDVGHLEDEVADQGEDKIAKKARLEQIEPMEVAQYYTNTYHKALDALNVERPSIEPTATGHIIEQIELIKKIMGNGFAYEIDGSVYFDMNKYQESYTYGELSGKVIDDLISGSRSLDGQSDKRSPHDFALWKKANPEHLMQWDSPWGNGFPGWHLECTAMSCKYLGKNFDIHGGGMDLEFPHHEGEIAQSFGAHGCKPVNYWMHNNMLTLNGQKMAKSKGNFITLEEMFAGKHDLLEKAYSPMTIRFFMLQSHYGGTVDFSNEALQAAEKGFKKLMNALDVIGSIKHVGGIDLNERLDKEINTLCDDCYRHMSDDFNTARTLASLFEMSSKIYAFKNGQENVNTISSATFQRLISSYKDFITVVLGLKTEEEGNDSKLGDVVDLLIELRNEARANKDYQLSDAIRDRLAQKGIKLKDEKDGATSFIVE